ncbi:hypothetical protein GGP44_003074 [Salinibacter ruber]|nr:hypothetical protein [Salinibacter ruber]
MPEGELHFFDGRGKYADRWNWGREWYEAQFQDAASSDLCGDKTPTYSYVPGVPKRMNEVVPDAKILWILRDPVDRAYSNYWHAVGSGDECLSFEEAVRREDERVKQDIWKGYIRRSQYIDQINRFLNYFDRDSMCFCLLESIKERPASVFGEVCSFLGVQGEKIDLEALDTQKNATVVPRSIMARYVRGMFDDLPVVGNLLRKLEVKVNRNEQPGYPEMPRELRAQLEQHFSKYNQKLKKKIGIDVEKW